MRKTNNAFILPFAAPRCYIVHVLMYADMTWKRYLRDESEPTGDKKRQGEEVGGAYAQCTNI